VEPGQEKGVIPITEAIQLHDPTGKLIGFIDSCFPCPDASVPSDLFREQEGD
jgi:hypothetical protein